MKYTAIDRCRICGNHRLEPILSLGEQHLTGVFPRTREQVVTRGPLELVKCHSDAPDARSCGLVQLRHSYAADEIYGEGYGYRSGLNQSMVSHLASTVANLRRRTCLSAGDLVLDIGSNDGTLLSCYPPDLTRVGMDPTAAKFRAYYPPGSEVMPEFFSAARFVDRFGERKAKIVTSIAMFYDLESPVFFAEQVAAILHDEGVWHFEQSHMPSMLAANAYDTICHEHLEYYGLSQILWVIERCGLKIVDVSLNDINGGSFAVTAAKAGSKAAVNIETIERLTEQEERDELSSLATYCEFRRRVFKHRDELRDRLAGLSRQGAKILGYGASTKGNVILQFCGITAAEIACIADINADKFGSFTPGTGIPIVSEAEAHAMQPDYLLVLPWHFRRNLLERERAFLSRGGRMIFPLPCIEIVGR